MYQNTPQISTYYYRTSMCVICVHLWNGFASTVEIEEEQRVLSIAEYRKLFNDNVTSDEYIKKRIDYLTRFARKIIKTEIQNYVRHKK